MFNFILIFTLIALTTQQTEWIFGYGSLISKSSRDSTYVTNLPWKPVEVFGIGRGWWAPGTVAIGWGGIIGQTEQTAPIFLGAMFDNVTTINGVIFQVNATALVAFDKRELTGAGYTRITVPFSAISPYDQIPLTQNDTIYFYNVNQSELSYPTENNPIVTSYVDLIMTACLDIDTMLGLGENFTSDFVNTTKDWSQWWVNDRLLPRRPWIYQPLAGTIDRILAAHLSVELLASIEFDNPQLFETEQVINVLQANFTQAQNTIAALQKSQDDLQANFTQAMTTIAALQKAVLDLQSKPGALSPAIQTIPSILLLITLMYLSFRVNK